MQNIIDEDKVMQEPLNFCEHLMEVNIIVIIAGTVNAPAIDNI